MRLIWIAILLLPLTVCSQSICPCHFKSFVSVGAIGGQHEIKTMTQLSGGVTYDQGMFYTGIGVGIDPYRFNSVPLFADVRINFGKKKNGFVYGNLGYNIPYDNNSEENPFAFKITDRFHGGVYTDAGIGYRLRVKGKGRLLLSAGHSYKRISNVQTTRYIWCPTCDIEKFTYRYSFNRIVAKLSLEFGK